MTEAIANVFAEAIKGNQDYRIEEKRSAKPDPQFGSTSELVCYIAHHKNGTKALVSWSDRCPAWLKDTAIPFNPAYHGWPEIKRPAPKKVPNRASNGRFLPKSK